MTDQAKVIDFETIDGAAVSEKASELNKAAHDMLTTYKQTQIKTNEHYVKAGEVLKDIKAKINDLNTERKTVTKPMDEAKNKIMDWFKRPIGWLQDAEGAIKKAMLSFQKEQKRIREEQERKLATEAKEREAREKATLEKRAQKAEEKGNTVKADALREQKEEVQHTAPVLSDRVDKVDGISTKKVWKFQIIDENLIPRSYLIVNEIAIGKIVRATKGAIPIPGIRIYSEDTIAAGSR